MCVPVMGVQRFQHFFRAAAGLDVDKEDLKRYNDFAEQKIYDLVVVGQTAAGANGRDVLIPSDLPITKGLQRSIHEFKELDEQIELRPILETLAERYPPNLTLDVETEARLPSVLGGVSVALARSFKLVDPHLENPRTSHWEFAFRLFDLLL